MHSIHHRLAWALCASIAVSGCSDDGSGPAGGGILKPALTSGVILGVIELEGLGACAGVSVDIEGPSGVSELATSSGGNFRVEGLASGAYAVRANVRGYTAVEDVFVYDAIDPRNVGTLTMSLERVPVRGRVRTSDGRSPAGAAVAVSAESEGVPLPSGISCGDTPSDVSDLAGMTTLVGPDGTWESQLPTLATKLRGVVQREGYTEEAFEVAGEVLTAAAAAGEPADAGEVTLYPLTGFVNAVGGKYQSDVNVDLQVSAFNGAGEMKLGQETAGICDYTGATWQPFDATPTYTATGDGETTICVAVRNDRGQEIELKTDVLVDTTAPSGLQATVGSGGPYVRTSTVNVAVSAVETGSGLATVRIVDNGVSSGDLPYGSVVAHTFGGAGVRTLEVFVTDRAGNESAAATATVTLDADAPTFAAARTWSGRTVTVSLSAVVDASPLEIRFGWNGPGSNDLPIATAGWQALPAASATTATVLLPAVDGDYDVQVQLRDAAGNLSATQTLTTVTVDENLPTNLAFDIRESASTSLTVNLDVAAVDTSAVRLEVSPSLGFASPTVYNNVGNPSSHTYTFAAASDGERTLYARFCDVANNCAGPYSDSVRIDTQAPTSPYVAVRSGVYATSTALTLDLFAAGADYVAYAQGTSSFTFPADFASSAYAPEKPLTLTGADGAKVIWVVFADQAGWMTDPVSATVTLDTAAPNTPTVTLAGGATATGERLVEISLSGYTPESGLEMRIAENPSFTGAVWQPVAAVFTHTLSAADGAKTVYVQLRDAAGNTSGVGDEAISLDTTGPTGLSFGIVGSPTAVSSATISLNLGGNDAAGQVTAQVSDNLGFVGATSYVFASGSVVTNYTIAGSDGYRTLYARFCDAAGNCEGPLSAAVTLDRVAPDGEDVFLQGGGTVAANATVTLVLAANGAAEMAIVQDAPVFGSGDWQTYRTQQAFTLTGGDGVKTIYVRYRDLAGNLSPVASLTLTLDTTGPTAGGTPIVIAGGASGTSVRTVTLTIDGGDADEMQVSESSTFAGASWEAVSASRAFELSAGDGVKTVYVRFRDTAGNTTGSYDDTIALDTTPPTGATLAIVGNPSAVSSTTVDLTLSATGASTVELANNLAFTGAVSFAYTTATATTISSGDGVKNIYARFCDAASNCSTGVGVSVILDTTAPSGGLLINNGAAATTSRTATLTISGSDTGSGLAGMRLQNDTSTGIGATSLLAFEPSRAWTLSGAGAETATKTVYLQVIDGAGNVSATYSDTIDLDNEGPTLTSVTIAAGASITSTRSVSVSLSATGADEMLVSQDAAFAGATWRSYAGTFDWNLEGADGTKTLYVRLKDAAGNFSSTSGDMIDLDTTPPTLSAVVIDGGAAWSQDLDVSVASTTSGSPTTMRISEGATVLYNGAFAATTSVTLAAGEGARTLTVRVWDAVGLASDSVFDTISVDTEAPSGLAARVQEGSFTTSPNVTVLLSASGADQVAIQESADFSGATWGAYATQKAFVLSGGDGLKTIYVQVRDAAGWTNGPVSVDVTLDESGPTPGGTPIVINGGDAGTSVRTVTLTIDAGDADEMQVSESASFAGASWEAAASSRAVELSPGDGVKTVYVRFRDTAGNTTGSYNDTISLDTTPPTGATLAIVGNPSAVSSTTVGLTFGATGAATIELANNSAFTGASTIAYSTSASHSLTAGDGLKTVYARYCDDAGNCSAAASVSVVLDTVAPSGGLLINNGASSTTNRSATLTISASDTGSGIAGMRLQNDTATGIGATSLLAFEPSRAWTLSGAGAETAMKTVYLQLVDAAGNTSTVASDSIALDNESPVLSAVTVNGGTTPTNNRTLSVALTTSGSPTEMRVSEDAAFAGATWTGFAASFAHTFSSGDGAKTLYVQVRDESGNASSTESGTVTIDTTGPSLTVAQINGGAAYASSLDVTVTTTAGGSPSRLVITEGASTLFDGAYSASETLTLAAGEGPRTLGIRVYDALDNASDLRTASIVVDTVKPTGAVLIAAGADRVAGESVTLNLAANDGGSGVKQLYLADSQAGLATTTATSYDQTKAWTLAAVAGGSAATRTVWLQVEDNAGNRSTAVSDSVTVDKELPTGTISLSAAVTNDTLIGVELTYDADVTHMRLSRNDSCGGGTWAEVAEEAFWSLIAVDGSQDVSVRFRDAVGNEGACYGAVATLDRTGPVPTSFLVGGNADAKPGYSNTRDLTVDAAADDVSCTWEMAESLSFSNLTGSGSGCTLSGHAYLLVGSTDGQHFVYVRFKDDLGNTGDPMMAPVVLDRSAPNVIGDGFTIVEGAYTRTALIRLSHSVAGASEMAVAQGATCGSSYEPYSAGSEFTLTGAQESKIVRVLYRDDAGNMSNCKSQTITWDSTPPVLGGVSLTGVEGIGGRTASQMVQVSLTGVTGGPVEMRVSNVSGDFQGVPWQVFGLGFDWQLMSGDGSKTVWVQLRDAAGNESAAPQGTIALDQTPPEAPALQLTDLDADGYVVKADEVELRWTRPAGTDHYELQRFIADVDDDFVSLDGSIPAATLQRVDSTDSPGTTHQYRIRARDDLGNTSSWSLVVEAHPYMAVTDSIWIRSEDQYRIRVTPQPGVFQFDVAHEWSDPSGANFRNVLGTNLTDWLRPVVADTRFGEVLTLKERNADNSLLYDTEVPLPFNARLALGRLNDYITRSRHASLVLPDGMSAQVFYLAEYNMGPEDKLVLATVVDGQVETEQITVERIDTLHATVDPFGNPIVAFSYSDFSMNIPLKIASKVILSDSFELPLSSGNWPYASGSTLVTDAAVREPYGSGTLRLGGADAEIRSFDLSPFGELRYRYFWQPGGADNGEATSPTATDYLRFQYTVDGVNWVTLAAHNGTASTDIKFSETSGTIPAAATAVRFINQSSVAGKAFFIDGVEIKSDSWVIQNLTDAVNGIARGVRIACDPNGIPYVVHSQKATQELSLTYRDNGAWVTESFEGPVGTNVPSSDVVIDSSGDLHIAYTKIVAGVFTVGYARKSGGAWLYDTLANTAAAGFNGVAIALDDSGTRHVFYTKNTPEVGIHWRSQSTGSWSAEQSVTSTKPANANRAIVAAATEHPRLLFQADGVNDPVSLAYDGSSWVETDLQVPGEAGAPMGIGIDRLGRSHFTYGDRTSAEQIYMIHSDNPIPHWKSGSDSGASSDGQTLAAALDRFGRRHMAYWWGFKTKYVAPDGTVQIIDIAPKAIDIAVDHEGFVHLGIRQNMPNALYYVSNKTGGWVSTLIDAESDTREASIAVDPRGTAHLGYVRRVAGNWQPMYINTDSMIPVQLSTERSTANNGPMAVDADGHVHMVYGLYGAPNLAYANNKSGTMAQQTPVSVSPGPLPYADAMSLVLDKDDRIHVVGTSGWNNQVFYATAADNNWAWEWVAQGPEGGHSPAVAVDSTGRVYAVYKHHLDEYLRLSVRQSPGNWIHTRLLTNCGDWNDQSSALLIDRWGILTAACHASSGGMKWSMGQFFGQIKGIVSSRPSPF